MKLQTIFRRSSITLGDNIIKTKSEYHPIKLVLTLIYTTR